MDGGEGISHSEAKIIVTMGAPNDPIAAGGALDQIRDQTAELRRNGVTGGIRNINHSGAGANDFSKDLNQELRITARRVFSRELDIIGVLLGLGHRFHSRFEHLLTVHLQLVFQLIIGSGTESVNSGVFRLLHRFQRALDISVLRARQTDHTWPAQFPGNFSHRLEIAVRRCGKPGFNDIDTKLFQLPSDYDFLFRRHTRARRLIAIAQGSIENLYSILLSSRVDPLARLETKTPAAEPTGVLHSYRQSRNFTAWVVPPPVSSPVGA